MKFVLLWGPVLLVMGLIFFFSNLPDPGGPPGGISDKTAHFLIYGTLGAALMRALAEGRSAAMTLSRTLAADSAGALGGAIVMTLMARLNSGWFRPSARP